MDFQTPNSSSRADRMLPLPSPITSTHSNFASLPAFHTVWGPDRSGSESLAIQTSASQSALQRTEVAVDIKEEPSGITTVTPGFGPGFGYLQSGSDSDQATERRSTPTASLSADELQRLKAKMMNLQVQVEDFRQQLSLVHQNAVTKDAQYARIIEQSTRREMQNLDESRRWRADREIWLEERRLLRETISHLNSKLSQLQDHILNASKGEMSESEIANLLSPEQSSIPDLPSSDALAPRHATASEHRQLERLKQESEQIIEHGSRLMEVGNNIQRQLKGLRDHIG